MIKNKKQGKIINIISQVAFNGSDSGKSNYAASKGGVYSFSISLAREVASHGINVNCVSPGMIFTDMVQETLEKNMDQYKKRIPLGRVAKIDEVADVVTFMASKRADYITGSNIHVSGGMCMR